MQSLQCNTTAIERWTN